MAVLCVAVFLFPGGEVALLLRRAFLATLWTHDQLWCSLDSSCDEDSDLWLPASLSTSRARSLYHLSSLFQRKIWLRGRQELVDSTTPCLHWCFWLYTILPTLTSTFLLLERCFWRLRFHLFPIFLRPTQGGNELSLLPLFPCFVEQNEDFHRRIYCAVVLQSGECFPPFVVVAKQETMLWRTEIHLNMTAYLRRNSSGLLA